VLVHNPERLGSGEGEVRQAVRQIEGGGAQITYLAPAPIVREGRDS
jgi:hypothetical protein